jgi:hypothetical protein
MLPLGIPLLIARNTPSVLPEPKRSGQRIHVELGPPCALVTLPVKLSMVDATKRNCEFV